MRRRGLSTIVGAVFFVLVMGSTIGYVSYSMDLVDDLAYQVDAQQDRNLNRQSEEFTISDINVDNNKFNLTVTNTGTLPINITKMWAKNLTDSTWNQTSYTINQLLSPGETIVNIGQGTGLISNDTQSYSLKLLTSRGNAEQVSSLVVGSQAFASGALEMNLIATSKSPLSDQIVTLIYSVKNNITSGAIQSIVPSFESPVNATGSATATLQGSIVPPNATNVQPGDIALFEAQYLVIGGNTEVLTFNATIANAVQGNFVQENATIDIAPVSESAINEVLGGQVGILSMNFTSFEYCKPEGSGQQDCTSDSSDWSRAWNVTKNTKYLYRLNITNSGTLPIILEKATNIIQLSVTSGGSGSSPKPYYIRDDSTPSVENPGAYTDLSKTLPANPNVSTVMYLGGKGFDDDALASTDSNHGIVAVFVVLFGYQDLTGDGKTADDPPYAQNLPFQAFRIHE